MAARSMTSERLSPAMVSADTTSASLSVSASVPMSRTTTDAGQLTTSQPSIVVQGKAAQSARNERPSSPHAPNMETSQPSIPIELSHAPAAVQAAAELVMAAHQKAGVAPPPLPVRPVPKPVTSVSREDSSASHMIAVRTGTVINGRYKLEKMIGRGGMGTVYQVSHEFTGEKLALKLLHPALAENEAAVGRFRTEARAPVRIDSEHVVRVVDADISQDLGDVPFMVMELLTGHDLRSELKRRGALPAGEVVLYLMQVAKALDRAHTVGIVHRDLKPANMYVVRREDGSPLVKVLDFGIAKLTDDAAKELTVAGQVFGTPWYMAPEQARGELGRVGPGTDLWALGLIAYQLLTGMNYWTADGMAALVGQICYEPMAPPTHRAPHLGPLFDMWFAHACNRDPSQRFTTAKEMINQLAQALGVNTSASISTDSGQLRHLDSSLQLNTPQPSSGPHADHSGYPPQGQLPMGSFPPNASFPPGYPSQHPSTPVPGTVLAHAMEGTNVPVVMRQPPQVKSSSTAAIALGVIVALLVGAAGVGVWLVSTGPTAGQPQTDTTATPAANDKLPDSETTADEADNAAETTEETAEEATEETTTTESAATVTTSSTAPVPTPNPKTQPPPMTPPPPYTPPVPTPKPGPKVAPKVGKVDF